jgi:gliding motility-associated protein GldM
MTPAVAARTILSKFENDVKNSEAMIVDYFYQQVGAVKQVFNTYQPLVGQSSSYAMPGQEITLTAGIGAYNADAKPTVTIDGVTAPLNANGVAEYKFTAGGAGSYTKHVVISYFNQATGKQEQAAYDIPITVGSPTGASVSADAVKVFYVGLENPISVSGGNVGDEKVHVSMTNGTLTKTGAGKYIVRPGRAGTPAVVTVNADGKASTFEFKVKDVPDPVGKVGINKGGRMRVNDFKAQPGVRADLENFVFEGVKFNVTGYTIVLTGAGFPQLQFRDVKGASFSSIQDLIEKCRPGSTVTIDNIAAAGPGGTRILPPIVFNLY